MLKKFLSYLLLMIISGALPADETAPRPPIKESSEGYLNAGDRDILLKPYAKRFYIPEQSELPVYEDAPSYLTVLCEKDDGAMLCKIPKLMRYVSLMLMTDKSRKVLFRGGIEAETLPLKISAGEELPVSSVLSEGYIAFVKRQNLVFQVYVGKDAAGISFSKKSRFDIYAEEQKKKNLYYHNGKWISKEQLDKIRKDTEAAEARKKDKLKNVKEAAEQGYMILKNSEVLEGKFNGIAGDRILFTSGGIARWVKLDEAGDGLAASQIVARGKVHSAGKMLEKAKALYMNNETGQAMRFANKSAMLLKEIQDDKNPLLKIRLKETEDFSNEIMNKLKNENKSLYNYQVFNTDELNCHLNEKHILFKNSIWLKPEQACRRCSGSGSIDCPQCNAQGYTSRPCTKCKNGYIQCIICEGRGWRSCTECNGSGHIMKKCRKCNGSGYVSVTSIGSYRPYRPVVSPGVIAVNGTVVVNIPPTCYYGPCYYDDFSYRKVTCDICGGSGQMEATCPKCNGSGRLPCPKVQKCPACGGKGIIDTVCSLCHGKKKISCSDCDGKGYEGKPQAYPPTEEKHSGGTISGKAIEKMALP